MEPDQQMMVDALNPATPQADPGVAPVSGLSPEAMAALFLVPALKFELGKEKVMTTPGQTGNYDIVHDKQGKVGNASLQYLPHAQQVHVDYLQAAPGNGVGVRPSKESVALKGNEWAHSLGTGEIRSLLRALGNTFPEAKTVSGMRVSGARNVPPSGLPPGTRKPTDAVVNNHPVVMIPRSQGIGGAPGQKLTDLW